MTLNTDSRSMSSVEFVKKIRPIEGADAIEVATVKGWDCVVKKGEFKTGDPVVYFEIDSALPIDDPRFSFLASRGARIQMREGVETNVHVLKTARLRGQYSQGLALPLKDFPEAHDVTDPGDLDNFIGVQKWEPPIPTGMGDTVAGAFPSFLLKTDAERVQNITDKNWIEIQRQYLQFIPTEKIDGTSSTFWKDADGVLHAAGRNWEIQKHDNVLHWIIAEKYNLDRLAVGEWIQGEIAGPGIQNNRLGLDSVQFFAFGMGRSDECKPGTSRKYPWYWWPEWAQEFRVQEYPYLRLPWSIDEAVQQVDGIKSLYSPSRLAEGVVWQHVGGAFAPLGERALFKAISTKWLLKNDG